MSLETFSLLEEADRIVKEVTDKNPLIPSPYGITPDIVAGYKEMTLGIKPISKTRQIKEAVINFAVDKLLTPKAAAMVTIGVPTILVGSGVIAQDSLRILSGVVVASIMHGGYKIGMAFLELLDEQTHH